VFLFVDFFPKKIHVYVSPWFLCGLAIIPKKIYEGVGN
jgi:hypothetical protein